MKYEIREVDALGDLFEAGAIPTTAFVCDNESRMYLDGNFWCSEKNLRPIRYATQEELDIINDLFVNL